MATADRPTPSSPVTRPIHISIPCIESPSRAPVTRRALACYCIGRARASFGSGETLQPLRRARQRPSATAQARPQVADRRDAVGHRAQRERLRPDGAATRSPPTCRSRHGSARPRPHRVRRRHRRPVAIARGVHENPPATIGLAELLRQVSGIARDQHRGRPRARSRPPRRSRPCRRAARRRESPSSRTSSPSWAGPAPRAGRARRATAARRMSGASSEGSRSKTQRSGVNRAGTRDVQTCGVMQFWFASQRSDRVSVTSGWWTVPPFFGTSTRRSHAGIPFATSF